MDLTRSVLISSQPDAQEAQEPKMEAVTAGISAAVAAGALAYNVGKDLLPRLQNTEALVIQIMDSRPIPAQKIYSVDLQFTNLGAHAIYVNAVRIKGIASTAEPTERPIGARMQPSSLGGDLNEKNQKPTENTAAFNAANMTPLLLEPRVSKTVRIAIKENDVHDPAARKQHQYCTFCVEYDDLSSKETITSQEAIFRVRGLPPLEDAE